MDPQIILLTLTISISLGAFILFGFLWYIRNDNLDDKKRYFESVLYDTEEDLRDSIKFEEKKKRGLNKPNMANEQKKRR